MSSSKLLRLKLLDRVSGSNASHSHKYPARRKTSEQPPHMSPRMSVNGQVRGTRKRTLRCFICRRLAELPCYECAATLRGEITEIDQNPERAAAAPHSFVLRALHRPVKAIADQLPHLDGGLCRLTELASVFVSPEDLPVVCVENRDVSTKISPQIIRGAFCTLGYKYSKAFGAETSGKVVRASQPLFGNLGK
ncbi:hypothetical protein NDA18_003288 [Ustilago nuda]|nr:hypothetical protein NDA18_003288 [Ustilago nuda]